MLDTILKTLFGTNSERQVKKLQPILEVVRSREARYAAMNNDELRAQTSLLKERIAPGIQQALDTFREGDSLDDEDVRKKTLRNAMQSEMDTILPDAFAVVREAAKRIAGMRPFDVQILGGIVLHNGSIAEMVTGEGKTLVATLPVYLNALTGLGVHVVTVNDYLARRDCEWMGPIYEFLGLTVGLIQHDMNTAERQVGYRADITYGTNNEFGFDYLRDNMAVRPEMRVQRSLSFAIVDEIDSILVDEARTPLIISGRPSKSTDLYYKVDDAVRRLRKETHYEIEEKGHHAMLTDDGMVMVENLLGVDNLYTSEYSASEAS